MTGISCIVPISLLTAMIDATKTLSSNIPLRASKSTKPSWSTGIISTVRPSRSSNARAAAKTHLCSMALTNIRRRLAGARRARPNNARLLASVAPDVKTISSASAPINSATEDADSRTTSAAFQPTT